MPRTDRYVHRSRFPVPVQTLFDWHARPGAFERLSPPWQRAELLERSGGLETGARTVLRVWLGPVPKRWLAVHTAYEPGALFQDTQLEGPFSRWVHTHRMRAEGPEASVLEDDVEYAPPLGGLGLRLGGPKLRRELERLFTYRHALTCADLARHARYADRPRQHVLVSGASGFIGGALVPFLRGGGHRVTRLVRREAQAEDERAWDPARGRLDPRALEDVDAVVHLAGVNVDEGRWTAARKHAIRHSRVEGTGLLARTMAALPRPPATFVAASGVSVYADGADAPLDEGAPEGDDFLAGVVRDWEAAAAPARRHGGIRVALPRIGVVLGARHGALGRLVPFFLAGGGASVGPGTQHVPWVSLEDTLGALHAALFEPSLEGPFNVTAPGAVTFSELSRTLAHVLRRPAWVRVPGPVLEAAFGELARTLLKSARVVPGRLQALGHPFLHPTLEEALRFTLGRPGRT